MKWKEAQEVKNIYDHFNMNMIKIMLFDVVDN